MGCSATKNLAVEAVDSTAVKQIKTRRERLKSSDAIPEIMGTEHNGLLDAVTLSNVQKTQHGLSFEIAFDDDKKDSQRKMPPKKVESMENKHSRSDLQMKLDEAEIRRQQILQQRVQSAKMRKNLKKQSSVTSVEEAQEAGQQNLLKVPENTAFINKFSVSAS